MPNMYTKTLYNGTLTTSWLCQPFMPTSQSVEPFTFAFTFPSSTPNNLPVTFPSSTQNIRPVTFPSSTQNTRPVTFLSSTQNTRPVKFMDQLLPVETKVSDRCELSYVTAIIEIFTGCSLRPKHWYHAEVGWQCFIQIWQKKIGSPFRRVCRRRSIQSVHNKRAWRFYRAIRERGPSSTAYVAPGTSWSGVPWVPNPCLARRGCWEIWRVFLQNSVQTTYAVCPSVFLAGDNTLNML